MGPFSALMLTGLAVAGILAIIGGMPFDTPMPTQRFGWVEPTCGLTRGSTAIARGALGRAWAYTPASFLVMGVGLLGVARLGWGCATGRWLTLRPQISRLGWFVVGVAVVVLWAHQQANADFVINARG